MVPVPAGFVCNVCQGRGFFGGILDAWSGLDGVGSIAEDGGKSLADSKIRSVFSLVVVLSI